MAFSPPEYCRLFAQKKAYQGGVTSTPGPPLATPLSHVSYVENWLGDQLGMPSSNKNLPSVLFGGARSKRREPQECIKVDFF